MSILVADPAREYLTLQRTSKLSPELFRDKTSQGRTRLRLKSKPISIPIGIHASSNGRLIVHMPGSMETVDGYCNKYRTLADFIQANDLAAVVRMDNEERDYHSYEHTLIDDLRFVVEYSLRNSAKICGADNPELWLMGFSGGTEAIGTIAHEFPASKILLMGPGIASEVFYNLKRGLESFRGELYLVQGQNDRNRFVGQLFYDWATNVTKKEMKIIPDCDHHFRHEANDKIYSRAPFWAFAGDNTFPDPTRGIRLVQKT